MESDKCAVCDVRIDPVEHLGDAAYTSMNTGIVRRFCKTHLDMLPEEYQERWYKAHYHSCFIGAGYRGQLPEFTASEPPADEGPGEHDHRHPGRRL
jgi:hypothetical protein